MNAIVDHAPSLLCGLLPIVIVEMAVWRSRRHPARQETETDAAVLKYDLRWSIATVFVGGATSWSYILATGDLLTALYITFVAVGVMEQVLPVGRVMKVLVDRLQS